MMFKDKNRCKISLRLVLGAVCVFGCSGCEKAPERFPVAGKVLVDGEPLAEGSVRFVPESGRPVGGQIQGDGTFTLAEQSLTALGEGIAPGNYRVAVSAMHVVDENSGEVEWLAPQKYADYQTSDLQVSVDGPQDDLILALSSESSDDSPNEDSEDEATDAAEETASKAAPENSTSTSE